MVGTLLTNMHSIKEFVTSQHVDGILRMSNPGVGDGKWVYGRWILITRTFINVDGQNVLWIMTMWKVDTTNGSGQIVKSSKQRSIGVNLISKCSLLNCF